MCHQLFRTLHIGATGSYILAMVIFEAERLLWDVQTWYGINSKHRLYWHCGVCVGAVWCGVVWCVVHPSCKMMHTVSSFRIVQAVYKVYVLHMHCLYRQCVCTVCIIHALGQCWLIICMRVWCSSLVCMHVVLPVQASCMRVAMHVWPVCMHVALHA